MNGLNSSSLLNVAALLFATFLIGCVTAKDMAAMIAAGGENAATVCGALIGGVVGMTIAPGGPMPVIPGAGYYGKGTFCRTNQPGSIINQNTDGSLSIQHGSTSLDQIEKRIDNIESAVGYLLRKTIEEKDVGSKPDKSVGAIHESPATSMPEIF